MVVGGGGVGLCVGELVDAPGNNAAPVPGVLGVGTNVLGVGVGDTGVVTKLLVGRNSGRKPSEPAVPCRKVTLILIGLFGDKVTFHSIVEPCNTPAGSLRMNDASGGIGKAMTPCTAEGVRFSAVITYGKS